MVFLQSCFSFVLALCVVHAKPDAASLPNSVMATMQAGARPLLGNEVSHQPGVVDRATNVTTVSLMLARRHKDLRKLGVEGRKDAVEFNQPFAQETDSRRRRVVIYQGEAGRLQQLRATVAVNVSLLAGVDSSLAFNTELKPFSAHSLIGSKAHLQTRQAVTRPTQEIWSRSGHPDDETEAATIPAFFSEWRSGLRKEAVSLEQPCEQNQLVEAGGAERQHATSVVNASLPPVPAIAITTRSTQGYMGRPYHESRAASISALLLRRRSSSNQNVVSVDVVSEHGQGDAVSLERGQSVHSSAKGPLVAHSSFEPVAVESQINRSPITKQSLLGMKPLLHQRQLMSDSAEMLAQQNSGAPRPGRVVPLPAFFSEWASSTHEDAVSFDDILAQGLDQNGYAHSGVEGLLSSPPNLGSVAAQPQSHKNPVLARSLLGTKFALRQPLGLKNPRWFESDADAYDAGNDPSYSRAGRNTVQTGHRFWAGHIPHGAMGSEHDSGPQSRAIAAKSRFVLPPNPLTYIDFPSTSLHGGARPVRQPSLVLLALVSALAAACLGFE